MKKVYVVTFEDSYEEEIEKEIVMVFDDEDIAKEFVENEKSKGKTYGMWDVIECELKTKSV